jgi:hypothetical protein
MRSSGNTGTTFAEPPGGFDASLTYRFLPTTRVSAAYYQLSAQPLGTDDPSIPVVFQGSSKPFTFANGQRMHLNATTHLRFQIYQLQQLFTVGRRHHPLVLAPTYTVVRSSVGGGDDTGPIFANTEFLTVHRRSYETKGVNLIVPLFSGKRYLISYTAGPIWNVNTNGANQTNHAQLYEALLAKVFAEARPNVLRKRAAIEHVFSDRNVSVPLLYVAPRYFEGSGQAHVFRSRDVARRSEQSELRADRSHRRGESHRALRGNGRGPRTESRVCRRSEQRSCRADRRRSAVHDVFVDDRNRCAAARPAVLSDAIERRSHPFTSREI